ncbi:MAG TPA: glycoside hydrolase family 88 protein [Acidobacteriaceae bacterium]|nr:glycoside hydrolase family 88 protein [Acidobacteriaceae bacterium]
MDSLSGSITLRHQSLLNRGLLSALAALLIVFTVHETYAQQLPWSQRVANTVMQRWPDGRLAGPDVPPKWNYELAILLNGMDAAWYNTADGDDYHYIQQSMDQIVLPGGSIPTYTEASYSLDNIALGRELLLLYRVTREQKYYKAALLLRNQLADQPRNASGGFWHKQIYPNQMWLDGLYMAEPFYAEYASVFHEPADFADITRQFSLIDQHVRSPKTGLLYHAWDESRKQTWAGKTTGTSHIFWARGMGWYMMALVDTLPYYSKDDPGRETLLAILNRTAAAVVRYQDRQTGLWYQVLDRPHASGNYFESSASCMFTYALQKGVRLGYLPEHYSRNAERAWHGVLTHFVQTAAGGSVTITGTVKAIGLGGQPYRDGSYHYYVSSPVVSNDPKGVGAFLLAATEMEMAPQAALARGDTVMLDAWFNSQKRLNAAGQEEYFHYKWNDYTNSGYSLLGHIFKSHGAQLDTLYTAPTLSRLRHAQFYIIVSPDNPARNPHPNYVQPGDADQVATWVKQGGVLLLMENDPPNADIKHLDLIADRFGIHFNDVLVHHIIDDQFGPGYIPIDGIGPIFHHPHTLYMKDTCTISVKAPAMPLITDKTGIVMARAQYGKGTVVAVVDPWLYNEYTDHRKVRPAQQNFAAGKEFVLWLLRQSHQRAAAP